jgi:hypothetical protein
MGWILADREVTTGPAAIACTVTDQEGCYRLNGIPIGTGNQLLVISSPDQPYLPSAKRVDLLEGRERVDADIELKRGVWIRGRVTEAGTGKPIRAHLSYFPFSTNPYRKSVPRLAPAGDSFESYYLTDDDGRYAIPGLPGPGIVAVWARTSGLYPRGLGAGKINSKFPDVPLFMYHAVAQVNPPEGAEGVVRDFELDPGQVLRGRVLDPEGRPLAGANYRGTTPLSWWGQLESDSFVVRQYWPDKPRTLQFWHKERKLSGKHILKGPQQEPILVRLQPWGVITGRVVDANRNPMAKLMLRGWPKSKPDDRSADLLPEYYYFTDENGRFRIEGLAAGMDYNVIVMENPKDPTAGRAGPPIPGQPLLPIIGQVVFDVSVEPGETKDLGDLPIKPLSALPRTPVPKNANGNFS